MFKRQVVTVNAQLADTYFWAPCGQSCVLTSAGFTPNSYDCSGVCAWSMTSSCENKTVSDEIPKQATPKRMEFVGVFLDAKSQDAIKARFQALHGDVSAQSSVVLKYNPSKEELDAFAPILGKNVTVQVDVYSLHTC
ncbi:hypothetical protein DYB25_009554 [Aphanomyces astaci]|uniref:Uncharacterized protein n=1 Tax=Aphanomyces astaci TaxID=112090 RepID=A0A397A7S7_APHAT|nr:hypothetical protein DYB25_009554 [Aphanomyces astaci]